MGMKVNHFKSGPGRTSGCELSSRHILFIFAAPESMFFLGKSQEYKRMHFKVLFDSLLRSHWPRKIPWPSPLSGDQRKFHGQGHCQETEKKMLMGIKDRK